MDFASNITVSALFQQTLVGLSRTTILFIVASGLSLILGVLRIPNVAHGSLYMIGAFIMYSVNLFFGGGQAGFWMAVLLSPVAVALISLLWNGGFFSIFMKGSISCSFSSLFRSLLCSAISVKMVWHSITDAFIFRLHFRVSLLFSVFRFPGTIFFYNNRPRCCFWPVVSDQ